MKTYKVAILGATGAVGREMYKVLMERKFPIGQLRLLASARSAGKVLDGHTVEEATEDFLPRHGHRARRGPPTIWPSAWPRTSRPRARCLWTIPAPSASWTTCRWWCREINPEDAKKHNGIIANPNCSTIISMVAVNALRELSPIEAITASTYQAVSGAGRGAGWRSWRRRRAAYAAGEAMNVETFPYQILFNLIPQIGSPCENGYTTEEMKMQNEGRKILHLPEMKVTCTCVRVPVLRSHSISLSVRTKEKISVAAAREAIAKARGCKLVDDLANKQYPMPLDTSDQDLVYVGRIRDDLTDERALALWCAGDQIRKGAATNAVQIAELLL